MTFSLLLLTEGWFSVLASCYSNLRDQFLYGFVFLPKAMANCTHASDAAYTDSDWGGYISINSLTPSNGFVSGIWQALFTGVKNCNTTLSGADFFEKNYAMRMRAKIRRSVFNNS